MAKIAFLGDSVVRSANVTLSESWAQIVGLAAGYAPGDIINAGGPGDETGDMLARLQTDVLAHAPKVCVMMLTVNDKTHIPPLSLVTHEANVRNIIGQLKTAGIWVVVASPPIYRSGIDTWVPWLEKGEEIAGDMGVPYIDVWRDYANYCLCNGANGTFNGWYNDGLIHQTIAGNARIAAVLCRPVNLSKLAPHEPLESGESGPCELELAVADLFSEVDFVKVQRALDAIKLVV